MFLDLVLGAYSRYPLSAKCQVLRLLLGQLSMGFYLSPCFQERLHSFWWGKDMGVEYHSDQSEGQMAPTLQAIQRACLSVGLQREGFGGGWGRDCTFCPIHPFYLPIPSGKHHLESVFIIVWSLWKIQKVPPHVFLVLQCFRKHFLRKAHLIWKEQLYPRRFQINSCGVPATIAWVPARGVWEVQPLAGVVKILVCIFQHIILSPKPQGSRGQILFLLDPSGPISLRPVGVGISL